MGVVQLPDELQRVIDQQIAEGRATTPAAFLAEAVMRLVEDARSEEDDILAAVSAGEADIQAGRYTTVATSEDERLLRDRIMKRLHTRQGGGA